MRRNIRTLQSRSWLAFTLCLASSLSNNALAAASADTIFIRNIYLNPAKQLVIEFDNPAHINSCAPQVLDSIGDRHDIILEFANASFAVGQVPRAKAVLDELTKTFSNVSSIAYAASNDATKARIKLSVSKEITTHPALAKVNSDSVVINLDLPARANDLAAQPAVNNSASTSAALASAASTANVIATSNALVGSSKPSPESTPTIVAAPVETNAIRSTELSATTQTAPAVQNSNPTVDSNAPATTQHTGLVHGIKGAWQSSIKAGGSKLGKLPKLFGSKNKNSAEPDNSQETTASADVPKSDAAVKNVADNHKVKQSTNSSVADNILASTPTTQEIPVVSDTQSTLSAAPVVEPKIETENTKPVVSAVPVIEPKIEIENTKPVVSAVPVIEPKIEIENTKPVVSAVPVIEPKIEIENTKPVVSAVPVIEPVAQIANVPKNIENLEPLAVVKPHTSSTEKIEKVEEAAVTNKIEPKTESIPATPIANVPTITEDKQHLDLPRITIQPKEITANIPPKEQLVAPLNPEDTKAAPKPNMVASELEPAPPLTTKTTAGDSSLLADLKTDFSAASTKENKKPQDKISENNQLATAEPAIAENNDVAKETTSKRVVKKVELASISGSAHNGGKDYFPPKVTSEGQDQESGYADETLKHYNEAVRYHIAGKLPEAVTEYRAAVAGNPRMEEAHSNLGLIFNQQNKYDQAMTEFHKALAINPKDAITYNGIGAAMRAQKNMIAAIKNWQTAVSLDPNLASAHYNLGTAYEMDKDLEKALSEYKLAVKYDDKLGEAYYHMGLILQKMDNRSLALEQFKQAVKVSSQADYIPDAKHRVNLLSQKKDTNNM